LCSTQSRSNTNGSASATATSTGGKGGRGGLFSRCCGAGPPGAGGDASAVASARSGGGGLAQAAASSFGGGTFLPFPGPKGGGASASAAALNSVGEALTTASAQKGSSAIAVTNATANNAALGSGSAPLVSIEAGQAVSNAILSVKDQIIGAGAMSAGYGGSSSALTYEATATFDFSPSKSEALDLKLLSYNVANNSTGIAFDNLELQVVIDSGTPRTYSFASLNGSGGAEKFFNADLVSLGTFGPENPSSIEIEYFVVYNSGTSAMPGYGFGFTYELVDPPLSGAIPEPSSWAMMLVGLAGLAFAGYRSRVRPGSGSKNLT
jgi:hypothetical protein